MNTKKTAITIVAAMMAIAMITTVAMAVICEKPCGTKVEQCDVETVLTIRDADDGQRICFVGDSVYLDMTLGNINPDRVTKGDIRLTTACDCGEPNTKVGACTCDEGFVFTEMLDPEADVFKYIDMNQNGYYDLNDPAYLSIDDDNLPSSGDIRLTDAPPYDIYDGDTCIIAAGEYGSAWDRLNIGSEEVTSVMMYRNIGEGIVDYPGSVEDLIGWVDGDCSADWTCPDKVYLQQPHDSKSKYELEHDHVVTIGDIRLYMPADEDVIGSDECLPDCGTKVDQCSKDAVYALMLFDPNDDVPDPKWGYSDIQNNNIATPGSHKEAVYIDMDDSETVTVGDVRLTAACSDTRQPNTKVLEECECDVNDPLETPDCFGTDEAAQRHAFKYREYDGLNGYTLGDSLYMDLDNNSCVSEYDVRITRSPLYDWGTVPAGGFGANWTVVGPTDGDVGVDNVLSLLPSSDFWGADRIEPPSVAELLGYVDTDCSRSWTCVDKLYLQQLRDDDRGYYDKSHTHFDTFVTIGDLRLYIPPEMVGDGPGEPCWLPCATKVEQCDVDNTYVLMRDIGDNWPEAGDNIDVKYSTVVNGVYLDMDGDGRVTEGDVRLVDTCTANPPNTKVGFDCMDDPDINLPLTSYPGNREPAVMYADLNGNGVYDLEDPIYLDLNPDVPDGLADIDADDIRLSDCPVYDDANFGAPGDIGAAWSRVHTVDTDAAWSGYPASQVNVDYIVNGDRDDSELDKVIAILDSDCSLTWTCPDKIYLQQPQDPCDSSISGRNSYFVTIGDHRLYIPPSPFHKEYNDFDTNQDCEISISEMGAALDAWYADEIGMGEMGDVLDLWYLGTYC